MTYYFGYYVQFFARGASARTRCRYQNEAMDPEPTKLDRRLQHRLSKRGRQLTQSIRAHHSRLSIHRPKRNVPCSDQRPHIVRCNW